MDYYRLVCKWFLIRNMKYVFFLIVIFSVLIASLLVQAYKSKADSTELPANSKYGVERLDK